MIFEGVKLMVVGMATVMLFLLMMIILINFVAFLTRKAAAREIQAIAKDRALRAESRIKAQEVPVGQEVAVGNGGVEFAVIAAAIAAYEDEMCIEK
ncbi:OadG family transporter subunit [Desulfocastanea catecholica]